MKKEIDDYRFLDLIKQGLKSGNIYKGNYEDSITGTPQGGIASPILFNIYMGELDEYIINTLEENIQNWNRTELREKRAITLAYKIGSRRETVLSKSIRKILNTHNTKISEWTKQEKTDFKKTKEKIFRLRKLKVKIPYLDKKKKELKIVYVRYADDWVLFTNTSETRANELKQTISEFLETKLKLKLSEEKTKITNTKYNQVKFLGYSLCYYADAIKYKNITRKGDRTSHLIKNNRRQTSNRYRSR